MCQSEKGDCKVLKKICLQEMKGILVRQWSRKKSYVIKWKQ